MRRVYLIAFWLALPATALAQQGSRSAARAPALESGTALSAQETPAARQAAPTAPASTPILAPTAGSQGPLAGSAPAGAGDAPLSSEPRSTTATFGDWTLRCQRIGSDPGNAQRSCEIAQSMQAQGQTSPLAEIAIGKRPGEDVMRATVLLPNNITLPSAVTISSEEKDQKPIQLTWHRCMPGGCFADAELSADSLNHWRSHVGTGRISFQDSTARTIEIPLSFRGLAQALDAYAKS